MIYDSESNCKKCKKWYDDTKEIVVAVSCIFCDDIIPGTGGKRICRDCLTRWGRKTPRSVLHTVLSHSSFEHYPRELLSWKRIIFLREQGITSLRCDMTEGDNY